MHLSAENAATSEIEIEIWRSPGTAKVHFWRSTAIGFRNPDYLMWVSSNRSADCDELGDVEAALAQLELGHECLPPPETLSKFYLRYFRILTSLHKQLDHAQIKVGPK